GSRCANTRSCVGVERLMRVHGVVKACGDILSRLFNTQISVTCIVLRCNSRVIFAFAKGALQLHRKPNILCPQDTHRVMHRPVHSSPLKPSAPATDPASTADALTPDGGFQHGYCPLRALVCRKPSAPVARSLLQWR